MWIVSTRVRMKNWKILWWEFEERCFNGNMQAARQRNASAIIHVTLWMSVLQQTESVTSFLPIYGLHIHSRVISFSFSFNSRTKDDENCLLLFSASAEHLRHLKATNFVVVRKEKTNRRKEKWFLFTKWTFCFSLSRLAPSRLPFAPLKHELSKVVIKQKQNSGERKTSKSWRHEKWIAIIAGKYNLMMIELMCWTRWEERERESDKIRKEEVFHAKKNISCNIFFYRFSPRSSSLLARASCRVPRRWWKANKDRK